MKKQLNLAFSLQRSVTNRDLKKLDRKLSLIALYIAKLRIFVEEEKETMEKKKKEHGGSDLNPKWNLYTGHILAYRDVLNELKKVERSL